MPSTYCKICRKVTGSYLFKYCSRECEEVDITDEDRKRDRDCIELIERTEKLLEKLRKENENNSYKQ